jgi:hypothetical protein
MTLLDKLRSFPKVQGHTLAANEVCESPKERKVP